MVKTGSLKVYIIYEDVREITLYKLEEGGFCALPASCILQSISYPVYIEAMEYTEVYILNISTFSKLTKNNIRVENFALNSAVSKFSTIVSGMEKILFFSINNRLSHIS